MHELNSSRSEMKDFSPYCVFLSIILSEQLKNTLAIVKSI